MEFKYQPLQRGQIRLVRLLSAKTSDGRLQLELTHHPFSKHSPNRRHNGSFRTSTSRTPADLIYTALSYTWGPEYPLFEVMLNGNVFGIRQNLHDFLLAAYTLHEHGTLFWIDQLCIDQTNISERNAVVRDMGHVYQNADSVRVWLGEGHRQADRALATFSEFNSLYNQWRLVPKSPNDAYKQAQQLYTIRCHDIFKKDPSRMSAFTHLMQNPYWTRQWIVQEIWLSNRLCLQCGTARLEREEVSPDAESSEDIFVSGLLEAVHYWTCQPGRRQQRHPATDLFQCRLATDGFQRLHEALDFDGECSDIRDKVFGLLGFVTPSQRIPVDYDMSATKVFWAAVNAMYADSDMYAALDVFGVRRLLGLADAMKLAGEISESEVHDAVEAIYRRKGWQWPPAKDYGDARWNKGGQNAKKRRRRRRPKTNVAADQ